MMTSNMIAANRTLWHRWLLALHRADLGAGRCGRCVGWSMAGNSACALPYDVNVEQIPLGLPSGDASGCQC